MRIDSDHSNEYRYPVSDKEDQSEVEFGITPSQTVGPYVHIGLVNPGAEIIAHEGETSSDQVEVTVVVRDGGNHPISDAMVEIWQAGDEGTYNSPLDPRVGDAATDKGFRGLGRGFADRDGAVTFTTIVPAEVMDEAPHLKVGIFARGMLERLYTRMYFPENADANEADPVYQLVDEPRRHLLVAEATDGGYRFDVQVQSEDPEAETPFFRV